MANKNNECVVDEVMDVVDPEKVLANRRKYVKDAMKPAEKARDELEKATATEKVRLQGTKETKAPNLKPYTEQLDVKDRFELGKLIEGAKKENRPWKVKRCSEEKLAEGYRYTFITTKLDEVFTESLNAPKAVLKEDDEEELPVEDTVELELGEPSEMELPLEVPAEEKIRTALDVLKDLLDIHGEGDKIIIAAKGQLDDEEAPKIELAIGEEDLAILEPEFHGDEKSEEEPVPEEEVVELELEQPKEEEEGELEEASSAEKKAFRKGGEAMKDLIAGRAIARVADPHERAMLVHQHRMEKSGRKMSDRPSVEDTLDRKVGQAINKFQKKGAAMAKAGMEDDDVSIDEINASIKKSKEAAVAEEAELAESVKISLDDLNLFKPWGGAKDTWELILAQDKLEALDKALEDMYPDGIKASDLNDILWFEKDWIFDTLDIEPFIKQPDAIEVDGVLKDESETEEEK